MDQKTVPLGNFFQTFTLLIQKQEKPRPPIEGEGEIKNQRLKLKTKKYSQKPWSNKNVYK